MGGLSLPCDTRGLSGKQEGGGWTATCGLRPSRGWSRGAGRQGRRLPPGRAEASSLQEASHPEGWPARAGEDSMVGGQEAGRVHGRRDPASGRPRGGHRTGAAAAIWGKHACHVKLLKVRLRAPSSL